MTGLFLTVDVEDWAQSTLDRGLDLSRRVVSNTLRLLDLMDGAGARGTFFILGIVAERFPDLVRAIDARGHEVASHGMAHQPVCDLGPEAFRQDLLRAVRAVENAAGRKVLGYRAPDFSIFEKDLWALEIMAEQGLRYDSSVFPFRGPRYGIPEAFRRPCAVICRANPEFLEFPLATVEILGRRLPVAGGGYFRLLPYPVVRAALRSFAGNGAPPTCYLHPYELDTDELRHGGYRVPAWIRFKQGFGRGFMGRRLARLFSDFRCGPIRDRLEDRSLYGSRVLDLTTLPGGPPEWRAG